MARLPTTKHDRKISSLIAKGASVANVAEQIGMSEPTVYNALKRLGLTLPSKSKATDKLAKKPDPVLSSTPRAASNATRPRQAPTVTKPRGRQPQAKRSPKPAAATVETATVETAPVATLVPVSSQTELLTERVDKGIESLRNLSAQIVRRERELAAARARYAETLASLALD